MCWIVREFGIAERGTDNTGLKAGVVKALAMEQAAGVGLEGKAERLDAAPYSRDYAAPGNRHSRFTHTTRVPLWQWSARRTRSFRQSIASDRDVSTREF